MPREFKCKTCGEEDPSKFPKGKKSLCKKCKNEKQNREHQEIKELLEKIKAEESKPETPRARSPSPSPHNYETFHQAVLDLQAMINKQAQAFELYKVNADFKIQALETQVQTLESRPIIINQLPSPSSSSSSSSSSSASSSPEASPAPSPVKALPLIQLRTPSPIRMRSKSPVKENPLKAEYKEVISKLKSDIQLGGRAKIGKNYDIEKLHKLAEKYATGKGNHIGRNASDMATHIMIELQKKLDVC